MRTRRRSQRGTHAPGKRRAARPIKRRAPVKASPQTAASPAPPAMVLHLSAPSSAEPTEQATLASEALPIRPLDSPHSPDSFQLGPVRLEAAPGWWFYPMRDSIAGRPKSGVGVFQVRPVPAVALPKPATHEVCMAAAMSACGYQVHGPGMDPARDRIGRCVFGGESFRTRGTFVRIYYHHGPRGFAFGTFSCKANRTIEKAVRQSIRDCDEMMLTVRLPSSHPG